jgi:hypothetical protein
MTKEIEVITLAIFRYSYRADILKALLSEVGIDSWISTSSMFRQIDDSAKLQIRSEDIAKARRVIKDNKAVFENDEIEEM